MGRRLSPRRLEQALEVLLPHKRLVTVEQFEGGGANGRAYAAPVVLERAQIIDDVRLIRDQYDAETKLSAIIYLERAAVADIPSPETRVTIWAGTAEERIAYVDGCGRYEHPDIADLLEVRLA